MHGKLYWKCLLVTKEVAMYLAGSRGCVLERGLVLSSLSSLGQRTWNQEPFIIAQDPQSLLYPALYSWGICTQRAANWKGQCKLDEGNKLL